MAIPVTREMRCESISSLQMDTPATLLILASILRGKGYDVSLIDANALNLTSVEIVNEIKKNFFDIIIFPICSSILDHDLQIVTEIKNVNPKPITITYSWFSRYFAKEILAEYPDLDIFIVGEIISIIGPLVDEISNGMPITTGGVVSRKNGEIQITDRAVPELDFNEIPMPAYDLLKTFKPYYIFNPLFSPYALMYCGKGCPFKCQYCNVSKTKYSAKSADMVIKELKLLKKMGNIKYCWFFDEVFTINKKRVAEICEGIIKEDLRIKWFCDSRVELVDQELLYLMRKAGCIGIAYGVESGSQKILDSMKKGNTVQQAKQAFDATRKAHIPTQLNLLLGYIGEDENTIRETKEFVRSVLPDILQVGIINPKPGTEFTQIAQNNKWIDEDISWREALSNGYHLHNYQPFNIDLNKEIQDIKKILIHNPHWWINCVKTLVYNMDLIKPVLGMYIHRLSNREKRENAYMNRETTEN